MMLDSDLRAGVLFIKIVLIPFYVMFMWVFISTGEFTPVQNIVDYPHKHHIKWNQDYLNK